MWNGGPLRNAERRATGRNSRATVIQEVGEPEIAKALEVIEEQGWCERGDSNPHGFTRQILSLVRLPIPPLSHLAQFSL